MDGLWWERHKLWITEKAHREWSNHLFLLNNHQRDPAGSRIKGKQANILLHMVHREAVVVPHCQWLHIQKVPKSSESISRGKVWQPTFEGSQSRRQGRRAWLLFVHRSRENGHTQVLSTVWPEGSTDSALLSTRKQENGLLSLDVMEKLRTSIREVVTECRAATVMASRGPASSGGGLEPQNRMYYIGPKLERGRKDISKAEHGESNPILSNLNSLCSFIMLSQETGNFQAALSQWGLSDTVTEPWFNRVLINFMHFKSGKCRASLLNQGLHAALR